LAHGEGGTNQTTPEAWLGRRYRLCRFLKEGAPVIRDRVLGDQTRQGGTKENDEVQVGHQLPCLVQKCHDLIQ
jgi:hypothetical protein